tara:strand:+ start:39 stop:455 length:417 start_codon:yes stop_codon:yes gene_type:complete
MKIISLILFLTLSLNSYATLSLVSHDGTQAFNLPLKQSDIGKSIGQLTVEMLDLYQIDYQGSELGLNSVLNSPLGTDAFIIISQNEMKSYGWCYSYNGIVPEVYPNEIEIKSIQDRIEWFWGYAHYLNGKWISQCSFN